MGVWPRKRAKKQTARVRSWNVKEQGLLAFPAYKARMTRVIATDTGKNSQTKGETIVIPATVLECPPVKIYSVRGYTKDAYGEKAAAEVVVGKDKHLWRALVTKKTDEEALKQFDPKKFSRITVVLLTQPSKTGIGQKKPQIFEAGVGGSNEQALAWINDHVGKEIAVTDVFKEGDYADAHGITTGRGFQGPVKRFGISLKPHKSEKGRRAPATLGGWSGQQHFMYRVAHAGQMGYHRRVQFNNFILKIGDDPALVNPAGGIPYYGLVKNQYVVVKGSIQGPKKRMITLTKPVKLYVKASLPTIEKISVDSLQRR